VRTGISLENVRWAMTTGHAANWHPLTWISHMLDCELFGLDATDTTGPTSSSSSSGQKEAARVIAGHLALYRTGVPLHRSPRTRP